MDRHVLRDARSHLCPSEAEHCRICLKIYRDLASRYYVRNAAKSGQARTDVNDRALFHKQNSVVTAHLSHSSGFALDQSAARADFDARFDGGHRTRPQFSVQSS
jgi:hypothetical protein